MSVYRTIGPLVLILLQNIDCGYSLEPPRRGGSNVYPLSMFRAKKKKNMKNFLLKIFNFYNLKNLCILHGHVFEMFLAIRIVQYNLYFMLFLVMSYISSESYFLAIASARLVGVILLRARI